MLSMAGEHNYAFTVFSFHQNDGGGYDDLFVQYLHQRKSTGKASIHSSMLLDWIQRYQSKA